jgi:ribosome modulation factor
MSSLDFDLDMQMDHLEQEWRQGYEAGIAARAAYQSLAASATTDAELLNLARQRLERAEALKAKIMAKIKCLESSVLGQD